MPIKLVKDYYAYMDSYAGECGLEIEMEGAALPRPPAGWTYTFDGSLKGNALEYVTRSELRFSEVANAVRNLYITIKDKGGKPKPSIRTGVHFHINVQRDSLKQLATLCTVWWVMENLMVSWCGPNRSGNLFCLRSMDANYNIDHFIRCFRDKNWSEFSNDSIRYSSLNLKETFRRGSVEFRPMRTTSRPEPIIQWCEALQSLYESSKKFNDPTEVISEYSLNRPEDFVRKLCPVLSEELISQPQYEEMLKLGMWQAQDFAFQACRDWDKLDQKKEVKKQPGKKPLKVKLKGGKR